MARSITLIATNDIAKKITLTRDGDSVTIAFNMIIESNKDLYFDIPSWAQPENDRYLFSGSVGLLVPSPGTSIYVAINATIREYFNLTFSVKHTYTYKGTFKYNAQSYENGIILDGQRLNCIATINKTTSTVMEDIQRNHQGELIASKTFDTTYKRTFNITTLPIANTRYKAGLVYTNTLEEMYNILYNIKSIGDYRAFHYENTNYVCLQTGEVSETEKYIHVDNTFHVAKIFTFTLEEV